MRLARPRLAALFGVAVLAALLLALPAGRAIASTQQMSIMEDDPHLDVDPVRTLARMRLLGTQVVRVSVHWDWIAPSVTSAHAPRGFNASNPAAYSAARWNLWDTIATAAHEDGITVDFDLMGVPRGGRKGPVAQGQPQRQLVAVRERLRRVRPSDRHAVQRGTYTPPGATAPLPRVSFWTVWNEPDYGPSLAPQGVPGNLKVENSPRMYRGLLDAAWSGLNATGHHTSTDTIAWVSSPPAARASGCVLRDQAAHLPACAVLRRRALPPASRDRGKAPGARPPRPPRGASARSIRRCSAPAA